MYYSGFQDGLEVHFKGNIHKSDKIGEWLKNTNGRNLWHWLNHIICTYLLRNVKISPNGLQNSWQFYKVGNTDSYLVCWITIF